MVLEHRSSIGHDQYSYFSRQRVPAPGNTIMDNFS
eukprot:CAMPEP_0194688964 /NCGR_PEP_ID=MMETSP0295-20121207/17283_1 /TAXON_ID=39354 /ORGANISM="Heterosigma akashiwo, Strain CCMP2393" /LENGTH=34 /DNA_ID= /DNA_START= /DNA_END= /DNA_ORIENTATION=